MKELSKHSSVHFPLGPNFAIFEPKHSLMKKLIALSFLLIHGILVAQDNTEIYVFDMAFAYEGYDNQPSFISNEAIVFAGNNNGQTDIAQYNLNTKSKTWVNQKTDGSEYSPQKFPFK